MAIWAAKVGAVVMDSGWPGSAVGVGRAASLRRPGAEKTARMATLHRRLGAWTISGPTSPRGEGWKHDEG